MAERKTVEQIIEENRRKLADPHRQFPAIQMHAVRTDSMTSMTVTYNHLTGEISWPAGEKKEPENEPRRRMPGKPMGMGVISDEDPNYFSEVSIEFKYGDSSVPYKLKGSPGNVSVKRLGPEEQFVFRMANGDNVLEKSVAEYNVTRKGE